MFIEAIKHQIDDRIWRSRRAVFMADLAETLDNPGLNHGCSQDVQTFLDDNSLVSKVRETGLAISGFGFLLGIVPISEFLIVTAVLGALGGGIAWRADSISNTLQQKL